MIFITGDIHGFHDIHKLSVRNFPQQRELSRDDFLIICGDFGLLWDDTAERKFWLEWLEQKPWTTLWIDGNHENFDMLKAFPTEEWHGGKVQFITPNILHLCRGSIFDIDGMSIFAFGGAESHDKEFRREGISWWTDELPTNEEMDEGKRNLTAHGNKVDIIVTHSLPSSLQKKMYFAEHYPVNRLTDFLDSVNDTTDFRYWFSGHYHHDMQISDRHYMVFDDILQITDDADIKVKYAVKRRLWDESY